MRPRRLQRERAARRRLREFLASLPSDMPPEEYFGSSPREEKTYFEYSEARLVKTFLAIPSSSQPVTCLDIGTTPFTYFVKRAFPHYNVHTLDKVPRMPNRFRGHEVQLTICNLDDVILPYRDGTFDVVIFTEVLEHVFAPPSRVLAEIHRILRPGGKLIISVPNLASLVKRLALVRNSTPLQNPDIQLKGGGRGHLHEYVMGELAHVLRGCGFRIESQRYVGLPSSYRLRRRGIAGKLAVCLLLALEGAFPSLRHQILIEAMR